MHDARARHGASERHQRKGHGLLSRPLLVIFLTILVNLIGFGIIVPLLPFYAERFGASPLVIGLLFGLFSLGQLVAAPILGQASDRYGRRPVLIFSLAGTLASLVLMATAQHLGTLFVARLVDGLSGGNISTARAYIADVTEPKDRARAYGLIGAAFGLGFILGPALSGALAPVSYVAPIWAAAALTAVAMLMALFWLPETVRRSTAATGTSLGAMAAMMRRPSVRRILTIDFIYWMAFAVFQTTFGLFAARRFGFDAGRTGYFLAAFGVLGVIVQTTLIRPVVGRLGDRSTLILGLGCSAAGLVAATLAPSVAFFAVALVPLALGMGFGHPTMTALVSRAAREDEQGRVQGAAGAIEGLGRAIGPVWGSASLQRFGEGTPYLSAAALLVLTVVLSFRYRASDADSGLA